MAAAPEISLRQITRERLALLGQDPKHSLGQNFLIDAQVLDRIMTFAQVASTDILEEIGPGLGVLTERLVQTGKEVLAIEFDQSCAEALPLFLNHPLNLHVMQADALKVNTQEIQAALRGRLPNKMVANLPYQIAASVILQSFQDNELLQSAVVMVQKEVAQRMEAKPSTKDYSAFTAKLALVATVKRSFDVKPSSFYPAPHVDSAVVELERLPKQDCTESGIELKEVCTLITAAFAQRRKTLVNSIAAQGRFSKADIQKALEHMGLSEKQRAETLSAAQFIRLTQALQEGE